jgi:hypothetical protein
MTTEADRRKEKTTLNRKAARVDALRPRSGYAWFVCAPQPSYSAADIARVFAPDWATEMTMALIRTALRHGELHAFRAGVTNRFPRDEVRRFVVKYHPLDVVGRADAMILSKAADVFVPMADLIPMLEAARNGHWTPPLETRPDLCWADEAPVGSVENERFPPPNDDHSMKTPPHLSNRVPPLRQRIQASTERDRAQARRARGKANGQNT